MAVTYQRKIVGLSDLKTAIEAARADGKTVVQCHGCFDIVHPGHIRYLQFARQQGDVLVVSLTGDADISKGDQRPNIPQELRAESLAALMFVDYVYIDPQPTAVQILGQVRPDYYVKGCEYERSTDPDFLAEKSVVEGYGGRLIFSSGEIIFSSTALTERLPQNEAVTSQKLALLARRHDITRAGLDQLVSDFTGLRVLVVGDILIDRYVFCDTLDVASESPMMSLVQREERSYVGGAAMVARHVAAMGAQPFLLTATGEDDRSQKAAEILKNEGVEANFLRSRPTIVEKTRFLVEDTKLLKVDAGQRLPLDSVAERQAARILEQQSKNADAVIFCDFGYGMITGSLLARTLPTLRHNVRILSADVSGGRADLLSFKNVDLLCPTERELRSTLNDFESGLSSAAWDFLQRTQARHLFVTLEKRGLLVFERRSQDRQSPEWAGRLRSNHWPTFATHAVDRLGCGDALLAAATLSLAAGGSLLESAFLGNAAAALEIAMLGNQPVDVDQLSAWIRRRPELAPAASTDPVNLVPA